MGKEHKELLGGERKVLHLGRVVAYMNVGIEEHMPNCTLNIDIFHYMKTLKIIYKQILNTS